MTAPAPIKVISVSDEAEAWRRMLNEFGPDARDIHFTAEYGQAHQLSYDEKVFAAIYTEGDNCLLMPFVLRDIRSLPFAAGKLHQPAYDMASLYTFGGPISRLNSRADRAGFFVRFQQAITRYCINNGVVTQFTAFHPLFENHVGPQESGLTTIHRRKQVVWIDLNAAPDQFFAELSTNHQRSVSKARKLGVTAATEPWTQRTVSTFYELYDAKMKAVGATPRWHLPKGYCENLMSALGPERVSLFTAHRDNRVMSSALILRSEDIAYYHFAGGVPEALTTCANHLLIFELALWAKHQGCRKLHLGGGLQPEDSLFRFKSGFSNCRAWFYTSEIVYDDGLYDELCRTRESWDSERGVADKPMQFFPPYRQ